MDDTTLFCDLNSMPEAKMHIVLDNQLEDISCWLASNKLSLNVNKTKCMIFHTNQRKVAHPDLKINSRNISRVIGVNNAIIKKKDISVFHYSVSIIH